VAPDEPPLVEIDAVKVTVWPSVEGLALLLNVSEVVAGAKTVTALEVLALKLPSPE